MIRELLRAAAGFGHSGRSIWATRGCRGEFEVVFADGGRPAE
jgi:hypothetical protein